MCREVGSIPSLLTLATVGLECNYSPFIKENIAEKATAYFISIFSKISLRTRSNNYAYDVINIFIVFTNIHNVK